MIRTFMFTGFSALLFVTSCKPKETKVEEETTFTATTPLQKDTAFSKDYVGQVKAIQHIELRALEKGYLQKIYIDEGQFVKKGQLLFQIMPQLYEAEVAKSQAEVNFAEIEYQNTKKLSDGNIVSPNELAMAKAKLDKAKAEATLNKVHLQFTEIRAPFDGIIDRFHVRQGSLLDEGDLLTTLSDNSKMWVYFNVPEAEYLSYATHAKSEKPLEVQLELANKELFDQTGTVETIEADFDNETGNIAFRATFPNTKKILRHGETGNIEMPVAFKNALLIPQKTTFEILEKKYVYVIGNDGVIHSREITIGAELPHLYVITDGLKPDDKILLDGLRKVENNEKIKFKVEAPEKVFSELNELHAE